MSDSQTARNTRDAHGHQAGTDTHHSRAQSGLSHIAAMPSAETSIEVAAIPVIREDGATLSLSYPSLSTPLSTQPQEVSMKRGIRKHMESGGGRATVAPRNRVAVRTISGSHLVPSDSMNWSSSGSVVATAGSNSSSGPFGDAQSLSSTTYPSQPAPYWQNTQQAIPRLWMQHAMSPAQQILRAATPSSHSFFAAESSGVSAAAFAASSPSGTMHPSSSTSANPENSALFMVSSDPALTQPPASGPGSASPSSMQHLSHRRTVSLMEAPAQQPLVPPYDAAAFPLGSSMVGDYIMNHSPVGNVGLGGSMSSFEPEANDALKEYTDAIRRLQRSPSTTQPLRSAQYRPLPIPFGIPPRSSPWQLQIPSDTNESPSTEEALMSASAPFVSPQEDLVDSLVGAPSLEETDIAHVPEALAHTQRPPQRRRSSVQRQYGPPSPSRFHHTTHQTTQPTQPSGNNVGMFLTLSQSQPSLCVPCYSASEQPWLPASSSALSVAQNNSNNNNSSGNSLYWHHRTSSGVPSTTRAMFPWDAPACAPLPVSAMSPTQWLRAATPTSLRWRDADNSLVIQSSDSRSPAGGGGGGGGAGLRGTPSSSSPSSAERHGGSGGAGGAGPFRRGSMPGSVENHPIPVMTSSYHELVDLLDVCRLLTSDVENVYGIVPSSMHSLQTMVVNVLTAFADFLHIFYLAFCFVPNAAPNTQSASSGSNGSSSEAAFPPRGGTDASMSTQTASTSSSQDQQDVLLELAQQLISDLEVELLPPLTAFAGVETAMQESRRRKELVAYWAVEVTSAMLRQLNTALMAPADGTKSQQGESRGNGRPCTVTVPLVLSPFDSTSVDASVSTLPASATTRLARTSYPDAADTPAPWDATTLTDVTKLVTWLGDVDHLREELEVGFPQLLARYLDVAVEVCVIDIALEKAKAAGTAQTNGSPSQAGEPTTTEFPSALTSIVAAITAPASSSRQEVEQDITIRTLPPLDEITSEFNDLSQTAAWSWWYSRQEQYLSAPRTQKACQRQREEAVRRYCETDPAAQAFFATVASNPLWCEQAREQQQLTAAQLENVLDECKRRGEAVLRGTLRQAIVRHVAQHSGLQNAPKPSEALSALLYRHLASLQTTWIELSQTSTGLGQDASVVSAFVKAAQKGLQAFRAAGGVTAASARQGLAPASSQTESLHADSLDTERTPRSGESSNQAQKKEADRASSSQTAVAAFLAAFSAEDHTAPTSHAGLSTREGTASQCAAGGGARKHSLLVGEGPAWPPHMSTVTARCVFVKTVHSACLMAAQQMCVVLQNSHYAIIRDERTYQMQTATSGTTLPLFEASGNVGLFVQPGVGSGGGNQAQADSNVTQSSVWENMRPSARALRRLQQSIYEVHKCVERSRLLLVHDLGMKR